MIAIVLPCYHLHLFSSILCNFHWIYVHQVYRSQMKMRSLFKGIDAVEEMRSVKTYIHYAKGGKLSPKFRDNIYLNVQVFSYFHSRERKRKRGLWIPAVLRTLDHMCSGGIYDISVTLLTDLTQQRLHSHRNPKLEFGVNAPNFKYQLWGGWNK